MFLGVWYLQLEVGTKIYPLCYLCDDAGHIYQSFLVFYALVTGFPGGLLLIPSTLYGPRVTVSNLYLSLTW